MMIDADFELPVTSYRLVALIPAPYRDAGNMISAAMGWGDDAYSVPIPSEGTPEYYMMSVRVSPTFVGWLEGEPITLPEGVNLDPTLIADVISQIKWKAESDNYRPVAVQMRDELMAELGLARVER